MDYSKKLYGCVNEYPFDFWLEDFREGIGLYSESECRMVKSIFDDLIGALALLGEGAEQEDKVDEFENAVRRLNDIRKVKPELIETMQREEFCELFDLIALAAGIETKDYGGGEGIASEWREW
tara:strand:+ start:172 stop:540 length:369 start_codon:yes stop_codon:yes gene_type:complete